MDLRTGAGLERQIGTCFFQKLKMRRNTLLQASAVLQLLLGCADAAIGFPVKWRTVDGRMFAAENISPQEQPASLFTVPAEYRKLDPQALLERIKRSDVWAEPAK